MPIMQTYKANCYMKLITDNDDEIPIFPAYIRSIALDYDYFNNIMPIIYAILEVNPLLYDQLLDNSIDGKIYLRVVNYDDNNGNIGIQKAIIDDQFTYFIPSKYNYAKKLNDDLISNDIQGGNTLKIVLGLMKSELILMNKMSFNGVYIDTTSKEILEEKILIDIPELYMDEIENNKEYKEFTILPQETRAQAIDYLFNDSPFFNSKYIYFMDFNKTYLINSLGNIREDVLMGTIIIDIQDTNSTVNYYNGIIKDTEAEAYILYITESKINLNVNTTTEMASNQIIAYSTDEFNKTDLNINTSKKSTTNKQQFAMATQLGAEIRKQLMDNTSVHISIIKKNMDSSIITPHRCYQLKYPKYPDYNGRYLILHKKDIIARAGEAFDTTTIIDLQRIASQDEE